MDRLAKVTDNTMINMNGVVLEMFSLAMWQIWIVAVIVLLIGEVLTPGFVLACFALACIPPAIIASRSTFSLQIQLATFAVSAILVFFFLRPVMLRFFSSRESRRPSNADALIGQIGIVVSKLPADGVSGGYVKVNGKEWWAFLKLGQVNEDLPVGTHVRILSVGGASVIVEPNEENDAAMWT